MVEKSVKKRLAEMKAKAEKAREEAETASEPGAEGGTEFVSEKPPDAKPPVPIKRGESIGNDNNDAQPSTPPTAPSAPTPSTPPAGEVTNCGHKPGAVVETVQHITHRFKVPDDKTVEHELGDGCCQDNHSRSGRSRIVPPPPEEPPRGFARVEEIAQPPWPRPLYEAAEEPPAAGTQQTVSAAGTTQPLPTTDERVPSWTLNLIPFTLAVGLLGAASLVLLFLRAMGKL